MEDGKNTTAQGQKRPTLQKKGFLKRALAVSRSSRTQLLALAEDLRRELDPQGAFAEFLFEKLMIDLCRLCKIYDYEQRNVYGENCDLKNHFGVYGSSDRFMRYKNSIEKDIFDGRSRLKDLKNDRKSL